MLVLGIDPGTAVTGYGVVSDAVDEARSSGTRRLLARPMQLVECGVIRTKSGASLASRLAEICEGVREVIARHRPDMLAVESAFYARNVRTALALGEARGVVLLAAAEAGIDVEQYPPAEIKKAVAGTGAATKEQVQYMLAQLLRLRSAPRPSDAADGVAAAVTGLLSCDVRRLANGAGRPRSRARSAADGAVHRATARSIER